MDTKLSFSNNTEKEVFEVLSDILKKDIADLLTKNAKKDENNELELDNEKKLQERKELLNFLMNAKDAGELNDLHEKYPSLNEINEKYYECLSSSCNKLLKLSFNIIRATKKCIAYLKIYKSYISTTTGVANSANASNEPDSMDYDLELINLIATHEANESENSMSISNNKKKSHDDEVNDDDENEGISFKEEFVDEDDDDDYEYEEEETINKKRKLIAKSMAAANNSKKAKQAKKIVKVVIGTRNATMLRSKQSDDESESENEESHNLRRGRSLPLSSNDTNVSPLNERRRTVGANSSKQVTTPSPSSKIPSPRKNYYFCDQCSFKTVSRDHLKLHTQTHRKKKAKSSGSSSVSKGKIIKCKHCNFFASDPNRIWEHQKSEHDDESEVITDETRSATALADASEDLKLNETIDLKEKQKQCDKCPYKTSDAPHLKRHMNNHLFVENFFKCRYCDYYLSKRSAMIQHEIIHSEYRPSENEVWAKKKKQTCLLCPYKANKSAHLKDHVAKHEFKEGYLKCRYCDYYVLNMSSLTQHEVIHPDYVQMEDRDKILHSCPKCPYKIDKPCHLAEHMLHHSPKEGYQKCRYCDYYVWSSAHLPQHEILHPEYVKADEKVKLFQCSKCPYQAKTKIYLKSHEESHKFRPNYIKCRYCDFYGATQPSMKRHEVLHTDEIKADDSLNTSTTVLEKTVTEQNEISLPKSSESDNKKTNEPANKLPVIIINEPEKSETQLSVV